MATHRSNSPLRVILPNGYEFTLPHDYNTRHTSTNQSIGQLVSKNLPKTSPRNTSAEKFRSGKDLSRRTVNQIFSQNKDSRTRNTQGSSTSATDPLVANGTRTIQPTTTASPTVHKKPQTPIATSSATATPIQQPLAENKKPNAQPTLNEASETASGTTSTQKSATHRSATSTSTNVSAIRPTPATPALGQATVTRLKIYSQVINWNGHSYTIRESLPASTTDSDWNDIVLQYTQILDEYKEHAGVSRLTLTLDSSSREMKIDIPSQQTISIPKTHRDVKFLFSKHPAYVFFHQLNNAPEDDDSDDESSTSTASVTPPSQQTFYLNNAHSTSQHSTPSPTQNDDDDSSS